MGVPTAPLSGPSVSMLCRSSLGEPADSGINSPPSGPLPPSLCWSCHDNQSSSSLPKTLQKQLRPGLGGKGQRPGIRVTTRKARGSVSYRWPPKEVLSWELGICNRSEAESGGVIIVQKDFSLSSIFRILTAYIWPRSFSTVSI